MYLFETHLFIILKIREYGVSLEQNRTKPGTGDVCARRSWRNSGGSNPLRVKVSHQPVIVDGVQGGNKLYGAH